MQMQSAQLHGEYAVISQRLWNVTDAYYVPGASGSGQIAVTIIFGTHVETFPFLRVLTTVISALLLAKYHNLPVGSAVALRSQYL